MVNEDKVEGSCSNENKYCEWNHYKHMNIWNNDQAMRILNGGQLHVDCSVSGSAIIKKHYLLSLEYVYKISSSKTQKM